MAGHLAQQASTLCSDWILQLEAEGKKPNTRVSYRASLQSFLAFNAVQPERLPYDQVTHRIVTRWIVWLLREKHMKERAINSALSAVRSFYRWLRIENYIYGNPLQDVRCLKAPKLLPKPISEPWIRKILKAAKTKLDRALFETLYACGGRISEMQGMNIGHVDRAARTILVMGKGKERVVHFGRHAAEAIDRWLSFRRKRGEMLGPETPLWVGCRWMRLDKKTMRLHLRELADRAGYPERIWPHRFRHSFFTHLLDHGADIREAQELGGHDNIVSTQIYTYVSTKRLRRVFDGAHPRA